MSFLDLIKIYKSEWEEVNVRKFDSKECQAISEATVVASKYGKSVCFVIPGKGKGFIPLEPIARAEIGDKLDPRDLELVNLKYIGDDPTQVKTDIMRVRIPEKEEIISTIDFNNPFGV